MCHKWTRWINWAGSRQLILKVLKIARSSLNLRWFSNRDMSMRSCLWVRSMWDYRSCCGRCCGSNVNLWNDINRKNPRRWRLNRRFSEREFCLMECDISRDEAWFGIKIIKDISFSVGREANENTFASTRIKLWSIRCEICSKTETTKYFEKVVRRCSVI